MSGNIRNRNQNESDSNAKRRKVVLALRVTNAPINNGCKRGRGRGRMTHMPPQRREVDLPKWGNHGRRRPYSRRPRRNIENLLQIIVEDRNRDTICLVCGDGREEEFIGCVNCPSTYHTSCVNKQVIAFTFFRINLFSNID
jgi:hypothetical protein